MTKTPSRRRKDRPRQPGNAELFRTLSDSLSDALLLLDNHEKIVFANAAAPQLLHRQRRSLLGASIFSILQLEDAASSAPLKKLPSVKTAPANLQATVNRQRFDCTLSSVRRVPGLNQIKNANRALVLRPTSPYSTSSANIQHQVIGQLAMRVAHDFNNQLTSILGNAELIQEILETLCEENPQNHAINSSLQMIHDIIRKNRETTLFIQHLQEYAQRQPDTKEDVDLNATIHNLLPIARRILGPKLTLSFSPSPGLPQISIDESQLHQIFFILIDDCKDRFRSGTLTIQTKQTTLDENYANTHPGARPDTYLQLTLTDSAPAIPPAALPQAFELFSKDNLNHQDSGTGMRLATIYSILKHMRGYISVVPIEHIGNKFDIYLPLGKPASPAPALPAATKKRSRPNPQARRALAKRTKQKRGSRLILVADSQPDIQKTLARCLSRAGYQTQLASTGDEALSRFQQLASNGECPALIIADLGLPGIDGKTLIRRIRQQHKDLPALLTTGHAVPVSSNGTKTADEQFNFLQKPFVLSQFLDRVTELLS